MDRKRETWVIVMTILGVILVWLPVIAPLVFGAVYALQGHRFMVDYLMPAELGLVAFAGAGLILVAALREKVYRVWVAASIAAALIFIVGGQALAVVSGLADGAVEPAESPWYWVIIASLVGYTLALVSIGAGGVCLLRHNRK